MTDPVDTYDSLLSIDGFPFLPDVVCDLHIDYGQVDNAGDIERGANGQLIDFTIPEFQKYKLTITARDRVDTPALDGIWKGKVSEVYWPKEISALWVSGNASVTLGRDYVTDTIRAILMDGTNNGDGSDITSLITATGRVITMADSSSPAYDVIAFYRPKMQMTLMSLPAGWDEWKALTSWTLAWEETGP